MALNRIATALGLTLATAFAAGCGEGSDDTADAGTGGSTSSTGGATSGTGGDDTTGTGGDGGADPGSSAARSWSFDPGTEELDGWNASFSNPESLALDATLSLNTEEGDPDVGSLQVVIPFEATQVGGDDQNQKIHLGVSVGVAAGEPALDLTGKTVTARFRLLEGLTADVMFPPGVKLYVKSTDGAFRWADGGWTNIESLNWMTVSINVSNPSYNDDDFDPSDIVEIGLEIATNGDQTEDLEPATVLIDSVSY